MSFYTRVKDFLAGSSAKGADVKSEFDAVAAAFDTVESSMVRSIKMPVGETTDQVVTGGPEARANKVLGCDGSGNVVWTTGVPASDALAVGGYAPSATAAANKVAVYNGSAKLPASITGDAATVGGYGVTTGTTALKVAVRDSNGALPGNITGNAATATTATVATTATSAGSCTGNSETATVSQACSGNAASATKFGPFNVIEIPIGDWNMDATPQISIPHGLTLSKIKLVYVMIRNDADTSRTALDTDLSGSGVISGTFGTDATVVLLTRLAGSGYDSTNFNSTSYNRGFITILYND